MTFCLGISETENHLNQIESARYLTNQLLLEAGGNPLYDIEANGMNWYMLHRLRDVLNNDFIEYNSRPYQNFTDNAIDYLAAVVALARESDWGDAKVRS